jgi:hypothetical protein
MAAISLFDLSNCAQSGQSLRLPCHQLLALKVVITVLRIDPIVSLLVCNV